ncbi:MAG: hypothetical protein IKN54_01700, partial [Lachnospiraceae bacterium]|nr:hypothetical protein [Lachnospiraceae bacterium]
LATGVVLSFTIRLIKEDPTVFVSVEPTRKPNKTTLSEIFLMYLPSALRTTAPAALPSRETSVTPLS